ncbi:hypothetical protein [Piscirickettsia salmonis]|uniref:hypothetical protein n=1 Tax=Piscirickettsia salmonis TaxID=1238 RepID=UPI003A805CB0
MHNTMIKVIKEGKGSVVTKGQETTLLAGSIYGGGNLGKNPAIIALSELGSGLFCAKATLQSEGSCLSWLKDLQKTLGNKITFYLTGKQSKEDLVELQILCEQIEIEALFTTSKETVSLYSLATGVNANGVIEKEDLDEKTGGLIFSAALIAEIEIAIGVLEKKINSPEFFANTKGRKNSVALLKELQSDLEELANNHIGPLYSESNLKFPENLKEKIDHYIEKEKDNKREKTETVHLLLQKIIVPLLVKTNLLTD